MRRRTCGTCGSHWRDRRARWCGHCGAPLQPAARQRRRDGRSSRVTAGAATAGVAAAVVAVALLVVVPDRWPDLTAQAAPEASVVLPDRTMPPQGRVHDGRARLRCRSSTACTAIRTVSAHRGPFLGATTDDVLVLAEGTGLTGYDLHDGDPLWRLELDIDPMQPVPSLAAVRGGTAVVAAVASGELVAVDAASGHRLWTRSAPGVEDVFAVGTRADHWRATVRIRHDNRSSVAHLDLDPTHAESETVVDPPATATGVAVPIPVRCCAGLVTDAARDGLSLQSIPGMAGGLTVVRDAATGHVLADLPLATYHGERLSAGRWLFVAPYRAIVVDAAREP